MMGDWHSKCWQCKGRLTKLNHARVIDANGNSLHVHISCKHEAIKEVRKHNKPVTSIDLPRTNNE